MSLHDSPFIILPIKIWVDGKRGCAEFGGREGVATATHGRNIGFEEEAPLTGRFEGCTVWVPWNWELQEFGEGKFVIQFPSKVELERSIAYGVADAKGYGVPLEPHCSFRSGKRRRKVFFATKGTGKSNGL